jgi:hypothetical protein
MTISNDSLVSDKVAFAVQSLRERADEVEEVELLLINTLADVVKAEIAQTGRKNVAA